jgi:acyl-CoA thioesterase-2
MPDLPGPDDCPTLGEVLHRLSGRPISDWDEEWAALDVRYAGDSRPGGTITSDGRAARARVWVRASGPIPDLQALHQCVLAYASDLTVLAASLVPHDTYIGSPRLSTASLDHAMWFHRAFRADEWLLYDQVSPSASGGRGFATGELFTEGGTLVASVAQEGLIRRTDPT